MEKQNKTAHPFGKDKIHSSSPIADKTGGTIDEIFDKYAEKHTVKFDFDAMPFLRGEAKGLEPGIECVGGKDDEETGYLCRIRGKYVWYSMNSIGLKIFKTETFIDRMQLECMELSEKICRIEDFLKSDNGNKLDFTEVTLLKKQLLQMQDYFQTLVTRKDMATLKYRLEACRQLNNELLGINAKRESLDMAQEAPGTNNKQ